MLKASKGYNECSEREIKYKRRKGQNVRGYGQGTRTDPGKTPMVILRAEDMTAKNAVAIAF